MHQSNVAGNYAQISFNGVRIRLTYLKAPGRGSIKISIDGSEVATINANSSSTLWQQTWTSQVLDPGTHTIRFQNASGGWIDLDAVQIFDLVPVGTHDDTNVNWVYGGSWTTYSGSGPYNNTMHQSNVAGNYAELSFTGARIRLTYLKASGRGSIKISIDGAEVTTIDANSGSTLWQQTWISDLLNSGRHTVRFENLSGGWIDLDAVQIFDVVPVGTYDDTNLNWVYGGSWTTYSGSGPYNNTLHQSNVAGNYAELSFTGARIRLAYLKASGRGSIKISIDGAEVTTIDANSGSTLWQQSWVSDLLNSGRHTVRFENLSGGWIDLDAAQIVDVVPVGVYDDTNVNWLYSGKWTTFSGSGPYNNTLHDSDIAGDYAELAFTGVQIRLTYLKASGRGPIKISIDGAEVATINANSSSTLWQQPWISDALVPGLHTVRFENAVGGWIDLDAIQIFDVVPVGIHDDTNVNWVYSGSWAAFKGSGPYNDTMHQDNVAGDYAELTFTGVQIRLTYLKAPGRGSIKISIDGAEVTTIDANSGSVLWQQTWTSDVLVPDTYTIRFENAVGGWIDLDAVQVFDVPVTIYDDSDSNWVYTGDWTAFTGGGPYNNTMYQNNVAGDYAELTFTGVQIRLTYLKGPGRGSIKISIDGAEVATIDANSSSTLWQQTWTSDVLVPDTYTIRFENLNGGWIDLDVVQIFDVPATIYDDSDSNWVYSGDWTAFTGGGPYNSSMRQSNVAGDYAELTFTGVQIRLAYLKAPGRGSIKISIDGAEVATIDANSSSVLWQQTWTSDVLVPDTYTIRFENLSGGWIDLDAIQIFDVVPVGIHDDTNVNWVYTGDWAFFRGSGPYDNTMHQDNVAGDYAELTFTGVQIRLTYLKAPGRGSIKISIDGAEVTTIDANNSGSVLWQQTWTSDVLGPSPDIYTVRFENLNGGWIDLDAIQVSDTPF